MKTGQRQKQYLLERYQALLGYTGAVLLILGVLLLVPLLVVVFYREEAALGGGFLVAGVPLIIIGAALRARFVPAGSFNLSFQEGTVIVLVMWVVAVLMSAVPFMTATDLTFSEAVFESTSGWTTTGLSVVDVTVAPRIILFYRSFLQLAGGAGFAIIALTALSGMAGPGFSVAEGRGDQLAPHVRQSATIVLRIYLGYVVVGIVALRLAGMGWFDAVNHAFTGIATGGFSTQPESIGHWNNPTIEIIIIVLMLLGSLNFLTAFVVLRGNWRAFVHNSEVHVVALVLPVATALLVLSVTAGLHPTLDVAARVALFEAVSALSGTGFSLSDYRQWADFGWLVIIGLMMLGGGTGSTAGGIKQFRIYVIYKGLRWELQRAFLPPHSVNQPSVWQGEQRSLLNDRQVRQVTLFALLYIAVFFAGSCIVSMHGFGISDSMFAFASALGTVGLSTGVTTFETPATLLWTQTVGMFLGRLEFFPVFIGLFKLTSDAREFININRLIPSWSR